MAGLLDYLFDPGTYSGGGLLSRLQPSMTDIPQSQGFPGQASPLGIGNYQMPRIGDMAQFTPPPVDPGALPQNAQPAQGQLPTMQPAFMGGNQPGIGDRLNAGLQNFANAGGLLPALAGGISGLVSGARTDPAGVQQQNQRALFDAYKNAGLSPAQAMVAVLNPKIADNLIGGGQTDDIKEFNFANRNPAFAKYMESKRAGAGEVGLNPVWGEDGKGNPVLGQLNKRGEFIQTKLPEGVTPSKGVDKVDLGTEWGVISKVNGQLVGKYPKDIVGKEAAEERGKARGLAQVSLPNVINKADQALKVIDDALAHPGRETATGLSGKIDPRNYIPGTNAKDFQIRSKQLQGKAFLEAFESLKGGGAISEREGEAATAAIARLDLAQSDAEYTAALRELRTIVQRGMEIARQKAGQGGQTAPQASDLKKKYGLD